tara:strand:- start:699 stop:929 length:231 start_codon:yes stop_codon:yes gene_type:complete
MRRSSREFLVPNIFLNMVVGIPPTQKSSKDYIIVSWLLVLLNVMSYLFSLSLAKNHIQITVTKRFELRTSGTTKNR